MDIKSEILDYINCNETTGALLLSGPWGCGKSYLAKQIAKQKEHEKNYQLTDRAPHRSTRIVDHAKGTRNATERRI